MSADVMGVGGADDRKRRKRRRRRQQTAYDPGASLRWVSILGVSLLLWAPTAVATLEGHISLDAAILRYAIALVLCWVGISVLAGILDAYSRDQERKREAEAAERAERAEETPRRRAEDRAAAAAEDETPRRRAEDRVEDAAENAS